ncbi:MAG: alpha/beta hydrolase [Pirellulaceae bacterium]|nr:alpha/beta hydrolase [Pirellulaceae bacterium]
MGRHVQRQTPRAMPTAERVHEITRDMPQPFLLAGCRGLRVQDNREPSFEQHGNFRFVVGDPADLAGQHVVCLVHGYNVTTDEGLRAARDFFLLLHAALERDRADTRQVTFLSFTWPGDTGTVYFNDAQQYAQHSGVALFELLRAARGHLPASLALVSHSLGAHVLLRALSVLGERRFRDRVDFRVDRALLLGAAIEDDVFSRPERGDEYHFPEAAFGLQRLHMVISRSDDVLGGAFRVNELDLALGHSGPETMSTLVSLARRVREVLGDKETFEFEVHDFSPTSTVIMNPQLHVRSHGDYWKSSSQLDYYINLLK